MGRLQLFEIRLSHGRVVYSPGEPLVGAVCVRLGAPLPFRGQSCPECAASRRALLDSCPGFPCQLGGPRPCPPPPGLWRSLAPGS